MRRGVFSGRSAGGSSAWTVPTYAGVALLTALVSYAGIGVLSATQSAHHLVLPPAVPSLLGDRRAEGAPFFVPSPMIALAVPRHASELGKGGRGGYRREVAGETQGELTGPGLAAVAPSADTDRGEPLLVPFTDGDAARTRTTVPPASPAWPWPTLGTISTGFSAAHPGLDIAAPFGAGVQAVAPGVVIDAQKRDWGLGWFLVLDHGGGMTSTYAHLGGFLVKAGAPLGQGQPIGWVGSTGFSTGPHLHFELHRQGRPLDPWDYLASEDARLYGDQR